MLSTAGLVAVTYGIIGTGDRGWTDARSLLTVAAGAVLLTGFVLWQRRAAAPLIDLALFGNRQFTGGAVLATIASFAMLGLLFSLPQFFSAVGGTDAFGAGLRLLPVIGGLLAGARAAEQLARRTGARVVISAGLALIAVASFAGARTGADTGYGYTAAWITLSGLGLGLTLPPAMNAALGTLDRSRSGAGNAVLQAMRQVGGAVGVAILGTVLNGAYRDRLAGAGLPDAALQSVSAGVAAAADPGRLHLVRAAFAHGMNVSLLVAGSVALAGSVLALLLMPARPARPPVPPVTPVLAESGV